MSWTFKKADGICPDQITTSFKLILELTVMENVIALVTDMEVVWWVMWHSGSMPERMLGSRQPFFCISSAVMIQGALEKLPCCWRAQSRPQIEKWQSSQAAYLYDTSFPLFFSQVLVLGNKRDLPNPLDEKQLIEKMWGLPCLVSSWWIYVFDIHSFKWSLFCCVVKPVKWFIVL